ncbi:hypothetical protein [Streptomyces acidiscabies]|uniref:Glucosyl-3-phosphoglycerate synthase n=1 Tax=Streptomyces acidiscabies TaxID=42234 RepID=A0AAP6BJV5_9ACTN|nr:hypothetical protein [Streptomyces acidiscabies]MBP5936759.1 hypothetical protein [Streptomyces sp. LBUM 1476]MBZ3915234.1 hypothetical protein [Streptomyces acidiscabies]MDX2966075.1 hypothetical protein [Streptomyces acidiscabies]MDX3021296.1 hypothetical protein [Streptomyces acidiscabies]MDX3793451.1 hypothetical protein [Streptomyces acidiscabies]
MRTAAILPSRNEASTIAAVTTAVDSRGMVVVNADSSDSPDTTHRFTATTTRAAKVALTGLVRGKGAQILAAARRPELGDADVVLIADTDTLNPDPAVYAALIDRVRTGAALAIADYPRHWDEANLTNHLARPLIAATTGHDIPQPLAGDLALSRTTLTTVLRAAEKLPEELAACVNGYGIDAFLLLTATGPIASVRVDRPKEHAGSFPHLAAIYHQAVPVLLHLTTSRPPSPQADGGVPAAYRAADREITPDRLQAMLTTLRESLGPSPDRYHEHPWPLPVAEAWQAVNSGTSPASSARALWPYYIWRVHDWLADGQHATTEHRVRQLAAAHTLLHTALHSPPGAHP